MLQNIPRVYAILLCDLSKAFEYLGHDLLAELAAAAGFPSTSLRIVILAYRWERLLVLEKLAAQGLHPDRGVCAGDFAATYCLNSYLFNMVKIQQGKHVGVTITIHVDDFAIELEDEAPQRLAKRLGQAARCTRRALEGGLKGKLVVDKSALA